MKPPTASYVTYEKVFNKCIKVGKSSGPDKISPKYLKLIGPKFCDLHVVVKNSISTSKVSNILEDRTSELPAQKGLTYEL